MQPVVTRVDLNSPVEEEAQMAHMPQPAMQVLTEAMRRVPILKYAFGVVGLAAAAALAVSFVGQTKAGLILIVLVFVGAVLLYIFSNAVSARNRPLRMAGLVLIWAVLVTFLAFLIFTVSAFAAGAPCRWARFLGVEDSCRSDPVTVTVNPKWGEANFHLGRTPTPAQMPEYRKQIATIKNSCARCVATTDRTTMIHPGNAPGFTIAQLAPGSAMEFDATRCETGVRYQFMTQQLRALPGVPAVGSLFAIVDIQPGVRTVVDLSGQHGFFAEPVQCLD